MLKHPTTQPPVAHAPRPSKGPPRHGALRVRQGPGLAFAAGALPAALRRVPAAPGKSNGGNQWWVVNGGYWMRLDAIGWFNA